MENDQPCPAVTRRPSLYAAIRLARMVQQVRTLLKSRIQRHSQLAVPLSDQKDQVPLVEFVR